MPGSDISNRGLMEGHGNFYISKVITETVLNAIADRRTYTPLPFTSRYTP